MKEQSSFTRQLLLQREIFHNSSKTYKALEFQCLVLFIEYFFLSEIRGSKLVLKLHPWGKIRMPDFLVIRKSLSYLGSLKEP